MQFASDRTQNPPGSNLLSHTRQQLTQALASAQQKLQIQAAELSQTMQQQAEQVRQQVAIAAWWLFISLLCSAIASASAGWLAIA
jgi:hypothetical protein